MIQNGSRITEWGGKRRRKKGKGRRRGKKEEEAEELQASALTGRG